MATAQHILHLFLQTRQKACTDTRQIVPGCIFFALKGPRYNGNLFAKEALAKGASYVVVDEVLSEADERYLYVADTLVALQETARLYRRSMSIPFIAITGSNGKTTTKELLACVLRKRYKTFATQGNFNNHIGVPLTLLSIPQDTEMAIIEMGANHLEEIKLLCEIVEPNYGLITNVGMDHLEGYGSLENVAKGNGELYTYLSLHRGTVFLNTDDHLLCKMASIFEKPITYPGLQDTVPSTYQESNFFVQVKTAKGREINTQLVGRYNFYNVAIALAAAHHFDVPESLAAEAIESYKPSNNRSQLLQKGTLTIVLDAYNANPSSMEAALESYSQMNIANKMVILGDMYELGSFAETEHYRMLETAVSKPFKFVIACGENFYKHKDKFPQAYLFPDRLQLENWLSNKEFENMGILLKGSRGMALEKIVDIL